MAASTFRYTSVSIALHWLMAFCVLLLVVLGLTMTRLKLPFDQLYPIYALHKSLGITVLILIAFRLFWRLTHRPPPFSLEVTPFERKAAKSAHWLLYVILFILPFSGWVLVSVSPRNIPTIIYGVFQWPDLPERLAPSSAAATTYTALIHDYLAYFLIALVLLHAAAALRHYFIVGDDVLQKMLPIWRRAPRSDDNRDVSNRP